MANNRNNTREIEDKKQKKKSYRQVIARHRMTNVYRLLLLLLAIAALVALIVVQYRNHVYTAYDIIGTAEWSNANGVTNMRLGESVFTYSKDGAHCTDLNGEAKWNQTFQIQDMELAFCNDTVAIGEYNGRNIYVANSQGLLGQIATNMPIKDLAVCESGRVTAVEMDTDVMWLNTYDIDGQLKYKGRAHMNESGYPTAISLSPNGNLLGVAYMYLDAGVLKTNVAFYNFGSVGDNYNDNLSSIYIYSDMVVPYIQFMNESTAFATADNRLMVYYGSQKPVTVGECLFDTEIRSVFYNERYIGVVFPADNTDNKYMLEVYDTETFIKSGRNPANADAGDGKKTDPRLGKYYFDMDYTDIILNRDNFVIYNAKECKVVNYNHVEKFAGEFGDTVELLIPLGNSYKYMMITEDSIDTIQLK